MNYQTKSERAWKNSEIHRMRAERLRREAAREAKLGRMLAKVAKQFVEKENAEPNGR